MTKILLILLVAASAAFAQSAKITVAQLYDGQLKMAEGEIVPAVEAMPEAKFNFAPANGEFKGVRTFGQQAKHLAAVIYLVSAAAKGEKLPVELGGESGPDAIRSKAQIVQLLKDAFAYGHRAMATLTCQNEVDMVKSPFGGPDMARGALAALAVSHSFDHYGQMVVYLRMNGIVPPASR